MKPNLETEDDEQIPFKDDSDICQQLLSRYSASKAPQHIHLLATAAAIRSILSAESLPLTPSAYFAAAIDNLSNLESLDSAAVAALSSFVSIVVPLIPAKGIKNDKASEAVVVLVAVVEREGLGAAAISGVVKCLGVLIAGFCDVENWGSLKEGFEIVVKLSVDKRPKVRRSAQDWLVKIFKSLKSSSVIKESSKLVLSLLKSYMPMALKLTDLKTIDGSKNEIDSKPGHLEVLHMLNLLKLTIPYLSFKTSLKVFSEVVKLLCPQFSTLTRHILKIVEAFFETSSEKVIGPHIEDIIDCLSSYVSFGEKNPTDTLISAATLLKVALLKLRCRELSSWMTNVPKVLHSTVGLLICETTTASQAADIMKEMINYCIDQKNLFADECLSFEDESEESVEARIIKSTCVTFVDALSSCSGIPNEHVLEVISALFLKLREFSFIFMKNVVFKLADLMNHFSQDECTTNYLQNCIGSSVVAMGPERILTLIPLSFDADNFTFSNIWLVPILKKHTVGASLGYYMEHIVPLAKSFASCSHKVKKSEIGQDLQAYAHGLWGLLPAFCHYPVDTHKKFKPLTKLLITFLKEDSYMHHNVAVAIQALVNQNKGALSSENDSGKSHSNAVNDALSVLKIVPSYSKKTATRNIKALASSSAELLQALVDLYVDTQSEKQLHIKDAAGCLASITDSSVTKEIFTSLLVRFHIVNGKGEFEKPMSLGDELIGAKQGNISASEKDGKRYVIMEIASSFIEGAKEDLINLIYDYVVHIFKETDVTAHCEAYYALSKILKEHAWFYSSHFVELIDLLLALKPPADVASLRNRFACFHILVVHSLEINLEEENTKGFLILNEIILTLKDVRDEARKVAYDTLLMISSRCRNSSCAGFSEPYHQLISMIMGYLSGPSPQIKSAAVSALSLLVYNDADICIRMSDLVPSLLSLLQTKAVEVIKAVLGFVKVLVSSLQAKDLQNLLPDIINGVLQWSSVSRFHFRSKVTVILEIMTRKCGPAAVESIAPEKFKSFVRTVLQNRHHKSNSREAGTTDVEPTISDSSSKRIDKRKHKELGSVSVDNGSMHHGKKKRKNEEFNDSRTKQNKIAAGDAKHAKSKKGKPADNRKKRKFLREPASGGKKGAVERKSVSRKGETTSQKSPSASSKLRKHPKTVKKQKVSK